MKKILNFLFIILINLNLLNIYAEEFDLKNFEGSYAEADISEDYEFYENKGFIDKFLEYSDEEKRDYIIDIVNKNVNNRIDFQLSENSYLIVNEGGSLTVGFNLFGELKEIESQVIYKISDEIYVTNSKSDKNVNDTVDKYSHYYYFEGENVYSISFTEEDNKTLVHIAIFVKSENTGNNISKEGYEVIEYSAVARDVNGARGKKIQINGEVLQVDESDEDLIMMRIADNGNYDNVWLIGIPKNIFSTRIIEGDWIKAYGISAGITTYESTLGQNISVPSVFAALIEVSGIDY